MHDVLQLKWHPLVLLVQLYSNTLSVVLLLWSFGRVVAYRDLKPHNLIVLWHLWH